MDIQNRVKVLRPNIKNIGNKRTFISPCGNSCWNYHQNRTCVIAKNNVVIIFESQCLERCSNRPANIVQENADRSIALSAYFARTKDRRTVVIIAAMTKITIPIGPLTRRIIWNTAKDINTCTIFNKTFDDVIDSKGIRVKMLRYDKYFFPST